MKLPSCFVKLQKNVTFHHDICAAFDLGYQQLPSDVQIFELAYPVVSTFFNSNSIQNSIFSTQYIVNTTMFSCIRRVEKGASRRQLLCGLVPYHNIQLLMETMISTIIIIMFLQCYCKVANIRKQGIVGEYTSTVTSKLK